MTFPLPSSARLFLTSGRAFWILIAGILVIVAAFAVRWGLPIHRQYAAIRALEEQWGVVQTKPGGPQWLRDRLGDEWMRPFDEAWHVRLNATGIRDGDLVHLKHLPGLQDLTFYHLEMPTDGRALLNMSTEVFVTTEVTEARLATDPDLPNRLANPPSRPNVTDAGLVHIAALTNLQRLNLVNTQVTDAGLRQVAGLTNLRRLDLEGTQVTNAGLEHLLDLDHLEALGLSGSRITDAALIPIGRLTSLTCLRLTDTRVTGSGFSHLQNLSDLRGLALDGSPVTDDGLARLAGMSRLKALMVGRTEITDAGLERLTGLTALTDLRVGDTRVTNDGRDIMSERSPGLSIWEETRVTR